MKKNNIILVAGLVALIVLAGIAIGTNIIGSKILVRTANKDFQKDLEFYRELGNHFVEQGKYDDAIAAYEAGLLLSQDKDMMNNLAVIYYKQGRYSEAISWLKKLIELEEGNPSYHYDLAVNLVDRFRNSKEQSLDDLLEALKEYELVEELEPGYAYAKENVEALRTVLKLE